MKKMLITFCLFCIFLPFSALAHKPLLMVDDNDDGTIYIETGFSDGSSGSGHTIRLKDAATGKILKEAKVPEEGSLDLKKPSVPYIVIFDAGEGHIVEAEGPALSSGDSIPAAAEDTETEETVSSSQPAPKPTPPPINVTTVTAPAPALVAVEAGYGAVAVLRMMMVTQVFIAVGIFLIFGVVMFFLGSNFAKKQYPQ